MIAVTLLFINGEKIGLIPANTSPGYVTRLFNNDYVHTIDLQVNDWDTFINNPNEKYVNCTVVIDDETYSQVGLRIKGNNSRRLTEEYGLNRYSLKLEFDHFTKGQSYYGLDKFSLDASFQDNSYLKTFLTYDMMSYMNVPTPLCSYVNVTVNGQPWGLYLAIEEPEEAFARRNFGDNYGKLYKPDYQSLNAENADIDLRYTDDNFSSYDNIFRNAKFDITDADKKRLINSLKKLSEGNDLDKIINMDTVIPYFVVQAFVINPDSYLGPTGHNYFLYEENGVLSILPWDYNLAFGTYCLGMTDPISDPNVLINYPFKTPWTGDTMINRPLFHQLMKDDEAFKKYCSALDTFIADYIESGQYEATIRESVKMIAPYVKNDATAFCTYEDFLTATDTLTEICRLRGESLRGQLMGKYPSTLKEVSENPDLGVNASMIDIKDLGDFDDLKQAQERIK